MIIGESKPIQDLRALIAKVASSKTNILVIGESGTGKELVARMIHQSGSFKGKPFVCVNCGAIPENLIETELFGHHKGSFTGAVSDKLGLFEVANGGTLFLDEVGDLPLAMQVKLLRALQERRIRKVGGVEDIRIDVRIIAATNRDLEQLVRSGHFRDDLYYRLNVILIKTPPLRERPGDIRILARKFLHSFALQAKKEAVDFSPEAWICLETHRWPGNVRELENVVERAVTLESSPCIQLASLPKEVQEAKKIVPHIQNIGAEGEDLRWKLPVPDFGSGRIDLERILSDVERTYILAAVEHAQGPHKEAAELLGMSLRSLRYRAEKLGLKL